MEIKYFTKKGSVYLQKIEDVGEFWYKKEKDGQIHPLAGAVHITRKKLEELIKEYPSALLDRTFCFDADVEREFLEDAKKEAFIGDLTDVAREKTVICFVIKAGGKWRLCCSSLVERMEESA